MKILVGRRKLATIPNLNCALGSIGIDTYIIFMDTTSNDIQFDVLGEVDWGVGQVHRDTSVRIIINDLQENFEPSRLHGLKFMNLGERLVLSVVFKYVDICARIH